MLAITPGTAVACSCTAPSLSDFADADGGFIGVVADRSLPGGGHVVLTYSVEQWLVGDHQATTIDIRTRIDGAACGIFGSTERPVALFYDEREGVAHSDLCSVMSPDIARLQLAPNAVDPTAGPARWTVRTEGSPHLWLLDDDGRIAGFTDDRPVDARYGPLHQDQCAGSSLAAEAWLGFGDDETTIVLRDLTTLEIIDQTTTLDREPAQIACYGTLSQDVWTTPGLSFSDDQARVVHPASGTEFDVDAHWRFREPVLFEPTRRSAVALDTEAVTRVDLTTGEAEVLVDLTGYPTYEDGGPGGFGTVSPNGSTLALYLDRITLPDLPTQALVVLVDLDTGGLIEVGRQQGDAVIADRAVWFGDDRLVLVGVLGSPDMLIDATTGAMTPLAETLAYTGPWAEQTLTSQVMGVANGTVRFGDPFAGTITTVGTLPVSYGRVEVLDPAVSVSADLPTSTSQYCLGLAVTVDIAAGELPTSGDDVILGTAGDDVIAAGDGDDVVCAGEGDDWVWGQDGDDIVYGGAGDDRLRGGDGNDNLHGEAGIDNLAGGRDDDVILGGDGDDAVLRGGTGDDVIDGGQGNDPLVSGNGGRDIVRGGSGNDKVLGGPRPDLLEGGPGADLVRGHGGSDVLRGDSVFGSGSTDSLFGSAGNDSLDAGPNGSCNGGIGFDTAVSCGTTINMEA